MTNLLSHGGHLRVLSKVWFYLTLGLRRDAQSRGRSKWGGRQAGDSTSLDCLQYLFSCAVCHWLHILLFTAKDTLLFSNLSPSLQYPSIGNTLQSLATQVWSLDQQHQFHLEEEPQTSPITNPGERLWGCWTQWQLWR